jgi:hypothetical protein
MDKWKRVEYTNTLAIDGSTYMDWNIVKTNNNVTTAGNKTVLGLLVESNTLKQIIIIK